MQSLLIKAPLTDTALPHLKKLTRLPYLELAGARISEAGVAELKKALPDTNIILPSDR